MRLVAGLLSGPARWLLAASSSLCVLSVACGDSAEPRTTAPPIAPTPRPSPTPRPTEPATPPPAPVASDAPGSAVLLDRDAGRIVGVTEDGFVAYVTTQSPPQLKVVAATGGTPTVLSEDFPTRTSFASVSGGAVGFWTRVDGKLGTFNVWTQAAGRKVNLTNKEDSVEGIFWASTDGTRIAFSVEGMNASTDLAVLDTASVVTQTVGILDTRISLTDPTDCPPNFEFKGRLLVGAYCAPGFVSSAQLHLVRDGSAVDVRLDNRTTGLIRPSWASNTAVTMFFVTSVNDNGYLISSSGNTSTATLVEGNIAPATGFFTPNADSVVYRSRALGLRRASTGGSPAPSTVIGETRTIQAISPDQTKVVVDTEKSATFTDLRSTDVTSAGRTPVDLVSTPTAYLLDFTEDSAFVLYLTDWNGNNLQLVSQPALGGEVKVLSQGILRPDVINLETGPGALVLAGAVGARSIKYVNASTARVTDIVTDASVDPANDGLKVRNRKVAYITSRGTQPGLYGIALP